MQIEGTSSSTATTSNIHFGPISRSLSDTSASSTAEQLNNIYREVVKLHKALESIEDNFSLRTDGDQNLIMSKTKARKITDLFKDAADALNKLFDNRKIHSSSNKDLEEFVSNMRSNLKSAVAKGFNSTSTSLQTDYGITFDFGVSARRVIDFTSLDQNKLIRKLTTDGTAVNELFYARKIRDNDGLLEKILKSVGSVESDLRDILGTTGVFIDTKA